MRKQFLLNAIDRSLRKDDVVRALLEHVENSKLLYSLVCWQESGKTYMMLKNTHFPPLKRDWQIYSILRACADCLIVSGKTLREEFSIGTYQQPAHNQDPLLQSFRANQKKSQQYNIYVLSRSLSPANATLLVNPIYYKLVNSNPGMNHLRNQTTTDIINQLSTNHYQRLICEFGIQTLNEIHSEGQSPFHFFMLTLYRGKLHPSCKGAELPAWLSTRYTLIWESQHQPELEGELIFKFYRSSHLI